VENLNLVCGAIVTVVIVTVVTASTFYQ